jgi:hypothetical protein
MARPHSDREPAGDDRQRRRSREWPGSPTQCWNVSTRAGQVRPGRQSALSDGRNSQVIVDARAASGIDVPAIATEGRLKIGADADISVFDPMRVIDKAT